MIGIVQFGLLVACVVLFLPMGMAAWRLSHNKVLFFAASLFITLAVCIHLNPYFPGVYDLVPSSDITFDSSDSCTSGLHNIVWKENLDNVDETWVNSSRVDMSWEWEESISAIECGFQKLGRFDASYLLNSSWVVVAGDSQARLFALSLLNLILDSAEMDNVRMQLFKRHSDYRIVVEENGIKLDFFWAPYPTNLTSRLKNFESNHLCPDVLVMSSGLWHMLHISNASDYEIALRKLGRFLLSFAPVSPHFGQKGPLATAYVQIEPPRMYWLGLPSLINPMLNTEEKKEKMNGATFAAYDSKVSDSGLLRKSGGPLLLLDMKSLSQRCGSHCTEDGMHYQGVVYEAAVQIMLNAWLVESRQRVF